MELYDIVYVKYKSKVGLLVQILDCSLAADDQVLHSCVFPAFAQLRKVAVTISP